MTSCATCGQALATSDVLYDARGEVICGACNEKAALAGDESKAGRNIKAAAITSAVAAACAFVTLSMAFGLGFWVSVVAAITSGLFAVAGMTSPSNARFVATMSARDRAVTWGALAVGAVLAAYVTLAFFGIVPFKLWTP